MGRERGSNIELLKIIAILLIVVSHFTPKYGDPALPSYIDLKQATVSVQGLLLVLFDYFGQIGNCLFVVCSAFFLVDQDQVKGKKILDVVLDCLFISVLSFLLHRCLGVSVGLEDTVRSFLPVSSGNCWFICCYLLLYAIHPGLNLIINKISQKQHLTIVCVMAALYSAEAFLPLVYYYYNDLAGFVEIYFAVAYLKRYVPSWRTKNWDRGVFLACAASLLGLIVATGAIGVRISAFSNQMIRWKLFVNPLTIMMSLAAFGMALKKPFICRPVNYVSGESLLIYIITEDYLFREMEKPRLWLSIYRAFSYRYVVLWVLLLSAAAFVAAVLIASCYRETVQKPLRRLSSRLSERLGALWGSLLDTLTAWK